MSKYGNKIRRMTALLTAVTAVLVLAGCGGGQAEQTETAAAAAETTAAVVTEASAEVVESTKEPTEPSIADGMEFAEETTGPAIVTPYITLYIPEEWEGVVEADQQDAGETHTVTFRTDIAGEDTVLFSLILGSSETAEGFPLGLIRDETAGTIYVFAAMNEEIPESWSEDAYDQFCSMQERVNDLIMQLHEDVRFSSGR